jgi:TP901 family phage tail tape measure protein
MADLRKTIQVIFQGTDDMAGALGSVGSGIDKFAGKVNSATQPLADFTDSLLKSEAALAAMAIGGLAFAFAKSIEFEGAAIELKKVLGDHPVVLEEARKKALELSNQYGTSASDVLLSTADFKQAGFNVEESFSLTKAAMDLVIAGSIESAEAAELLVRILKGFKAPGTDAAQVLDILNEVSNNYAVSTQQLGEGMATLSPIAKQMGFSFEETAGILTPVIEIFQSGSEAANALKTGLLRLIDDNPTIIKALEDIGVAQRDQTGALRAGKDILYDVMVAFTTLSENEKLYYAQQLVGINQAAKMVEVFNGLDKTLEVTKIAFNSTGSAAAEVTARLASGEVAVDRFKQGFLNLAIAVGDGFREAAKEAIDGGTAIENALQGIIQDGTFQPVFDIINDFAGRLATNLAEIAKVLPEAFELIEWQGFTKSIDDILDSIGDLFRAFFGDLDLTKPEDLAKVFQKAVDSLTALNQVVKGILDSFRPFLTMLGDLTDEILESDEKTKDLVGQFLGWAKQINIISGSLGGLTSGLQLLSAAMFTMSGTSLLNLIKGLGGLTTSLGGVGASLATLGTAVGIFAGVWVLKDIFRDTIPFVDESAKSFQQFILTLQGVSDQQVDNIVNQAKHTEALGLAAVASVRVKEALGEIPTDKVVKVGTENFKGTEEQFSKMLDLVKAVPSETTTIRSPRLVN